MGLLLEDCVVKIYFLLLWSNKWGDSIYPIFMRLRYISQKQPEKSVFPVPIWVQYLKRRWGRILLNMWIWGRWSWQRKCWRRVISYMRFLMYWDLRTVHIFQKCSKNIRKCRRIRSEKREEIKSCKWQYIDCKCKMNMIS